MTHVVIYQQEAICHYANFSNFSRVVANSVSVFSKSILEHRSSVISRAVWCEDTQINLGAIAYVIFLNEQN